MTFSIQLSNKFLLSIAEFMLAAKTLLPLRADKWIQMAIKVNFLLEYGKIFNDELTIKYNIVINAGAIK